MKVIEVNFFETQCRPNHVIEALACASTTSTSLWDFTVQSTVWRTPIMATREVTKLYL